MELMAYRALAFAALVAIATLNREMTGLLIVLSLIASKPRQIIEWLPSMMAWGFIIVGFRVIYPVENAYPIPHVFSMNTTIWRYQNALFYMGLLFPILLLFYVRLRTVPKPLLIKIAIVLIPYFALWLLFASYQEVRLLMPLFILGIPIYANT